MPVEAIPIEPLPSGTGYITASDLQTKIPPDELEQLLDRDQDGVEDDNAGELIDQAIADGTGTFHTYLARRYSLPLNTSDTVLMAFVRPILLDLCHAALYPRADMVSDKLQGRIDGHLERLAAIRDGQMDMPSSSPPPSSPAATSGIKHSSRERKMGEMP